MAHWRSMLVRLFGFPATLIHGDTLVLDRWIWLRNMLPSGKGERLIEVGCGTGAFTIGMALRGYSALGLSWDERNNALAEERAGMCGAGRAAFQTWDVRKLNERCDLVGHFDVAICTEVIEHILDDAKLLRDIALCLKPGGILLLTTPYKYYRSMSPADDGSFSTVEDGGHVRRGYTFEELDRLCQQAGLAMEQRDYCSGILSQKLAWLLRVAGRINIWAGWGLILPFRWLPPLCDRAVTRLLGYPFFCVSIRARKSQVSHGND